MKFGRDGGVEFGNLGTEGESAVSRLVSIRAEGINVGSGSDEVFMPRKHGVELEDMPANLAYGFNERLIVSFAYSNGWETGNRDRMLKSINVGFLRRTGTLKGTRKLFIRLEYYTSQCGYLATWEKRTTQAVPITSHVPCGYRAIPFAR